MRTSLSVSLLIALFLTGFAAGQTVQVALEDVKQIKLLVSNRDDVRKILASYNTTFHDDHYQRFSNDAVDIRVTYASGTCSEEPEYEDHEDLWKVSEWKVTRIEIEPSDSIDPADIGFDLSKLSKQQEFEGNSDSFIYHDKKLGIAIKSDEDGINEIIYFPSVGQRKNLCGNNDLVTKFYASESYFPDSEFAKQGYCSLPPSVTDITLASNEISAITSKAVSVSTSAVDPENDFLIYKYFVSAGKIIGSGAKVVWDLTGVPSGTYTITAAVDEGAGVTGRTVTKTVVVK